MCCPVPTLTLPASRSLSVSGAAGSSRPDTDFTCIPLAFSVRRRRFFPPRHIPARPHTVTACPRKLTLEKRRALRYNSFCKCRCGSMAEHKLPKLVTRVRFPSSARRKAPRDSRGAFLCISGQFYRRSAQSTGRSPSGRPVLDFLCRISTLHLLLFSEASQHFISCFF